MLAATGTQIGLAQVMTFAIPLGVFGAVVIWAMFSGRSGHERHSQVQAAEPEAEPPEHASTHGFQQPSGEPAP
jgi:Flp pilus assembly protein protease CpaA